MARRPRVVGARTLIGAAVSDRSGNHLGRLVDLAIDPESGAIAYGLLHPQLEGDRLLDQEVAVPWSALDPHASERSVVVDLSLSSLKRFLATSR